MPVSAIASVIALPNVRDQLREADREILYLYYQDFSQPAHASWEATRLYERNLGTMRERGEFIAVDDWAGPMRLAWLAMQACFGSCLRAWEASASFPSPSLTVRAEAALTRPGERWTS